MDKPEKVIKGLECCIADDCDLCPYDENVNCPGFAPTPKTLLADALALLKAQEPRDDDADFMTHIICEICDYAVKNEMEPNDTLLTITDNIKALLKISTFNNWKVRHHG